MFSQSVYEWGLNLIRAVQSLQSAPLTVCMKAVSFLSDPKAYMLILPLIFLCFDEKRGAKLTLAVLFAGACNDTLKNTLKVPRPYAVDPAVGLDSVSSFSTPSGHSQASASFWPYAMYLWPASSLSVKKRRAVKIALAAGLPLCIGFSRVYLGVHYPSDVLLGWALGFLFSLGLMLFSEQIERLLKGCTKTVKILILALIAAGFNAISSLDPSMAAAFFGFGTGYVLLCENGGFCAASGTAVQKALRMLVFAAVTGGIYFGLKAVFPAKGSDYYVLFRFIRYALAAFSTSFIVPKLCIALKIAGSRP